MEGMGKMADGGWRMAGYVFDLEDVLKPGKSNECHRTADDPS